MSYTNHSGGAKGSDMIWEIVGLDYGVSTIAYSFKEHKTISRYKRVLNQSELNEGWKMAQTAAAELGRHVSGVSDYVKKLLSRDWFQVKNSNAIFAIGRITENHKVEGGTGYAVQLAILNKKPVNVFNLNDNEWYRWDYEAQNFIERDIPVLVDHFAGIGTRDITPEGEKAIRRVYKKTFFGE